jgi:hypothetical protein
MKTKIVHCKKETYDIYIGRGTPYGNPFVIGKDGSRSEVIQKYREWILEQPELIEKIRKELKGKTLGCWCKPKDCHGDIIIEIIENPLFRL